MDTLQSRAAEAVTSTHSYEMCDVTVLVIHGAECLQSPAICPIRGHLRRPCSWVIAFRNVLNICHTHNLHTHYAWPTSPPCLYNPPSRPANPQYSGATGHNQKHPLNAFPSCITDLSHLKKICCCLPSSPSPSSNKVCSCVSRDKSPVPTL